MERVVNGIEGQPVELRDGDILDQQTGEVLVSASENRRWQQLGAEIVRIFSKDIYTGPAYLLTWEDGPEMIPAGVQIGSHIIERCGSVSFLHAEKRVVGVFFNLSDGNKRVFLARCWQNLPA